jgi:hypothetical protein
MREIVLRKLLKEAQHGPNVLLHAALERKKPQANDRQMMRKGIRDCVFVLAN